MLVPVVLVVSNRHFTLISETRRRLILPQINILARPFRRGLTQMGYACLCFFVYYRLFRRKMYLLVACLLVVCKFYLIFYSCLGVFVY